MYARQINSEELHTIREISNALDSQKLSRSYKVKQKLLGVVAIGVSIASPLLLDGDATISLIMLPLGIYVLFTKEKVIM